MAATTNPDFSWTDLGTSKEISQLSEYPQVNETFIVVDQGGEGVSTSNFLFSSGFEDCSAQVVINVNDGSMLLKHIGPKSGSPESSEGFVPQSLYKYFLNHAAASNATVLSLTIKGSRSNHTLYKYRPRFVREEIPSEEVKTKITELEEIRVDTGEDRRWAIAVDPQKSIAIVISEDRFDNKSFHRFQLPQYHIGDNLAAKMLEEKSANKKTLDKAVLDLARIPSNPTDPETIEDPSRHP